jgi:hypothetical protein
MKQKPFPRRAIHLDFHTMPGIYDVGRDFDGETFSRTLAEAQVDYITVLARCNLGFAYYPTQVGVMHPGLKFDLLGGIISACHRRDIRVATYLSAGLDHEQALRHREWCKVNKLGQVYEFDKMGNFFRNMCFNSGYREHLLAEVEEVLRGYPVDGIFLDSICDYYPCYGHECIEGMAKAGLDAGSDSAVAAFQKQTNESFRAAVEGLVRRLGKGRIFRYYNALPYRSEPTHIELEILPTGGWGYDFMPAAIRYARTLGKPYFTMTGRFHRSWGDFGGIRTEPGILFDLYNSVANGGTVSIGDHMHPRGVLDPEVYRIIGNVYAKIRQLEPWTDDARPVTDIAVYGATPYRGGNIMGAARLLLELKQQFDVVDSQSDLAGYRLLVLPDDVVVDAELKAKLARHLRRGGSILSSARAGLAPSGTKFACKEYALSFEGDDPHHYTFYRAGADVARDMPAMLTTIYSHGTAIRPGPGATVLAQLYKPYFNWKSWDWRHENFYIPPEADAGRPAVVQSGRIIHFSFPVFSEYYEFAVVAHKTLVRNCLERLLPNPVLQVHGLPSFAQASVTQKGQQTLVHLLAYLPEMRGKQMQVIEEPIHVPAVEIGLRGAGSVVRAVYRAPERTPLEFRQDGEYVRCAVGAVEGYALVVFEHG